MIFYILALVAFALLLSLGNIFMNAGKRWENGERWELPQQGKYHR